MDRLLIPFKQNVLLNTLFFSNFFLSLHYALIIYINSSFLSVFFKETQVSALFMIGSIVGTAVLIIASRILDGVGVYRFTRGTIVIEALATLGMAVSTSASLSAIFFVIHMANIGLVLFNMDVLVESIPLDGNIMGEIRATYLTITNLTIVLAPLLISLILTDSMYGYIYLLSSLSLLPMYLLTKRFRDIKEDKIQHISVRDTVSAYTKNADLFNIYICHQLLQLFYAFMTVYTPIYLHKYMGFSWTEIGGIFTIMLLPFVLFELPLGELSDEKYGESEFLTIGFIIMGISTLFMSFVTIKSFWIWATILFITRTGASFVEISSESYFFKKVKREETDVISFLESADLFHL